MTNKKNFTYSIYTGLKLENKKNEEYSLVKGSKLKRED